MSSENIDWLKKVKTKLSFDTEEGDDTSAPGVFVKPKANAIKKNYTAKDLTGLQVAHELDAFQAGQSDILVLADRSVLEDDGEESSLVSVSLKEEARLKRLREVARHAKGYSGYKAYEEETESVVTLGSTGSSGKVLQKYDFASGFDDEPGIEGSGTSGFKIGSVKATRSAESTNTGTSTVSAEFDTVQSAGIDTLNLLKKKRNATDMEKEKKRAKKLAKTLFADEPEMIVDVDNDNAMIEDETVKVVEEDDSDMQRIISATRREHLKSLEYTNEQNGLNEKDVEPKFIGGKSFDTLIMSESIFTPREEEFKVTEEQNNTNFDVKEDSQEYSEQFEPFSAEPLVRDGVASTLALLKMRGINLTARSAYKTPSAADIKLEYFDQFGNKLNSKEAYKELSRKFHGKGPGKGRLEKMKRRREETIKMESAGSSNQSAIVANLRRQQEETGEAYMILSSTRQQSEVAAAPVIATAEVTKPKIFGLQLKKK